MEERSQEQLPSRREIALLLAGAVVLLVIGVVVVSAPLGDLSLRQPVGDCNVHVVSQLAGTGDRFALHLDDGCGDVSVASFRVSLGLDIAFAAAYGYYLRHVLRRTWSGWRIKRLRDLEPLVPLLPVAAAAFDMLEDVVSFFGVVEGLALRSDGWGETIAGAATIKWVLLGLTAFLLCTSAAGTWNAVRGWTGPVAPVPLPASAGLGICCSGGGIRSAGYTLGALRALDDAGELESAEWLAAVSGGAYTAGAYLAGKLPDPTDADDYQAPTPPVGLDVLETSLRAGGHRFLSAAPGGFARSALWMLGVVVANIVVIAAALVLVAWPIGFLLGSWVFNDAGAWRQSFTLVDGTTAWDTITFVPGQHWRPGAALVAVGAIALLARAVVSAGWGERVTRAGQVAIAVGLSVLAVFAAGPLLVETLWWVVSGDVTVPAVFGVSVAAIGSFVWRFAQDPLVKLAPRLGGVLLIALLVAGGTAIAVNGATGTGRGPFLAWLAVTTAFAAFYFGVDTGWMSARLMYRDRLRHAFVRTPDGTPRAVQPTFTQPHPHTPELLICAAAQRNDRGVNGIPADSFTVSRSAVSIGSARAPAAAWFDALPRRMHEDRAISSWQATTGAAFSSAMGRFHYGSTNALLAALNIDLGSWFPNPRRLLDGYTQFPQKIRSSYLVKEIFGLYDPDDDFVFVADGGQWENLGLVELLRRRCSVIVCIDASGDGAGSYTTLREAVQLATTELDVWVDLGFLDGMTVPDGGVPPSTVGATTIHYDGRPGAPVLGAAASGTVGLLLFAKAQVAADLPLALRRYAARDATFPRYSTADQLLTDEQFDALVDLGAASGTRLLEEIGKLREAAGHQVAEVLHLLYAQGGLVR